MNATLTSIRAQRGSRPLGPARRLLGLARGTLALIAALLGSANLTLRGQADNSSPGPSYLESRRPSGPW
jgi:hypothetical protein